MAVLKLANASYFIKKKQLLDLVSFEVQSGQIVVFLGPNGAGKTTLLRSVMGLSLFEPPQLAQNENLLFFDDQLITSLSTAQRVELGLVYLAQHSSLFNQMSLYENLALIQEYHLYWKSKSCQEFEALRDSWLNKVGLEGRLEQKAGTLSGGQKRKLEIVRAVLMQPKILLLDEPFAGVDPKSIYELKAIFAAMAKDGIGMVISDHNVDQLLSIAHKVYVMMTGRVITSGSVRDILSHKETQDMYLGNQFYTEMNDKFLDK